MKKEYRSIAGSEFRASDEGEGIIEGYVAVWNTVDSYNSTFQRGAFTKTISERGSRVKLLWNHKEEVIGKVLELREDDHGVFVRAKLTLAVAKAAEIYALIRDEAIDTFSFGFRTIKDKWIGAVRHITEVALFEVSPVIFEANENAVITGVRAMPSIDDEKRSQEYHETFGRIELARRRYVIMDALHVTLDDVLYGEDDPEMLRAKTLDVLTKFSAMYQLYIEDLITAAGEQRSAIGDNLVLAFRKHLADLEITPEQFAATTEFNIDEVRALLRGNPEVAQAKVALLPEEVRTALAQKRAERLELLCSELRAGISEAERDRIDGLLNPPVAVDPLLDHLRKFRESLSSD